MNEAELIAAQRRKIEELENQILQKKTDGANMMGNMSEMFKGMKDKMTPIFEALEKSKSFVAMKPSHLTTMLLNRKKCEVGISEGGVITIVFTNKEDAFGYYNKLTKK